MVMAPALPSGLATTAAAAAAAGTVAQVTSEVRRLLARLRAAIAARDVARSLLKGTGDRPDRDDAAAEDGRFGGSRAGGRLGSDAPWDEDSAGGRVVEEQESLDELYARLDELIDRDDYAGASRVKARIDERMGRLR